MTIVNLMLNVNIIPHLISQIEHVLYIIEYQKVLNSVVIPDVIIFSLGNINPSNIYDYGIRVHVFV